MGMLLLRDRLRFYSYAKQLLRRVCAPSVGDPPASPGTIGHAVYFSHTLFGRVEI